MCSTRDATQTYMGNNTVSVRTPLLMLKSNYKVWICPKLFNTKKEFSLIIFGKIALLFVVCL